MLSVVDIGMDAVLVVTAISVLTTFLAWAFVRLGGGDARTSVLAPGLAAGVMLWIAAAEIGPGATAELGLVATVAAMAAGGGLVVVASRVARRTTVAAGVAPVLGVALVLHDLPEGFALGSILQGASLVVALPVVIAFAAHNLPEKLALMGPARAEGAALLPVLAAATLPEPIGAALAGVGALAAPGVAVLATAVAGGMMVVVAIGALPTVARRAEAMRPFLVAGGSGVVGMALLGLVLPA